MSVILSTKDANQSGKFFPGKYSRPMKSGTRQARLFISFLENGAIELSPEGTWLEINSTELRYQSFGHVLKVFVEEKKKETAYYSFFFSDRTMHLSSLMDDSQSRRMAFNGTWKLEM